MHNFVYFFSKYLKVTRATYCSVKFTEMKQKILTINMCKAILLNEL